MFRRLGIVLVMMLAAVGCTGDAAESPPVRLASAVEAMLADAWQWELTVQADLAALEAVGDPNAAETLDLVRSFRLGGVVDGSSASLYADLDGVERVVDLRTIGRDAVYARVLVDELAALAGTEVPDVEGLLDKIREWELDASIQDLVRAAAAGEWVGLTGLADLQATPEDDLEDLGFGMLPSVDPSELERVLRDTLGSTTEEFVDRYASVTEIPRDSETTFDVTIQLRDLVQELMGLFEEFVAGQLGDSLDLPTGLPTDDIGLGSIPQQVPLTAVVRDGELVEIRIDLVEIAQSVDETARGTFVVVLTFDDGAGAVTVPDGAAVVTGATLQAAAEAIMVDFFSDLGDFPTDFPTDLFSELSTETAA